MLLVISDAEHLFMYLLTICLYSVEKMSESFAHFLIGFLRGEVMLDLSSVSDI